MSTQKRDDRDGSESFVEDNSPAMSAEGSGGKPAVTSEHEFELFPPAPNPHFLGTGSYRGGGSNAEGGGSGFGDINPLGGYGTFTDAGGFGSTTLYGESDRTSSSETKASIEEPSPEDPFKASE